MPRAVRLPWSPLGPTPSPVDYGTRRTSGRRQSVRLFRSRPAARHDSTEGETRGSWQTAPGRRGKDTQASARDRQPHQRCGRATTSRCPTTSCAGRPRRSRSASTKGETTDDLLVEAFAVVREAAKRTLGQRHFDVQLMGGAALHLGNIAEMKTGEGKTLVSTLPAYLNALEGKGVHVVTVNDYLAKRDSEWMGRVHRFLGLEVGVILSQQTPEVRKAAYARRHHLRHQQRVRLRLPARQHGLVEERPGAARSPLRDRRRGRLDPDRRGADAADHLRSGRPVVEVVLRVRPAGARGCTGDRRLRGRRVQADRRGQRGGRHQGRAGAGHREPLRVGEHPAGRLPEQRAQGQGALQEGPRLHRGLRRGADRRRVHRPGAARPPLQRGHAPGDRGQRGRRDQGREPDPGHHHPAELLPALREALRDDRYRADRGRRAAARPTSSAWCRSRRTGRSSAPTRPT